MKESRNPKGRQFGADEYFVVNNYFIEYVAELLMTATRLIAQKDSLTQGDAKAIKTLIEVFNERVNDLRGGEYTPAENELFLNELAKVNLYAKDKCTVQNPFDSVKLHDRHGKNIFSIRFSDYFLKLIGGYIRDNWGELYD